MTSTEVVWPQHASRALSNCRHPQTFKKKNITCIQPPTMMAEAFVNSRGSGPLTQDAKNQERKRKQNEKTDKRTHLADLLPILIRAIVGHVGDAQLDIFIVF
jgi:hypothetical protein